MDTIVFYVLAFVLLAVSLFKDRKKTAAALKKAWKAFENMLPQLLVVMLLLGVLLTVLDTKLIARILGGESGFLGVLTAALVGAVTLIPGFVAFPMAAMLMEGGAGSMQIGAFVSALMMVGIVTLPVEIQYFGKKTALLRNVLAFVFSFGVAYIIGWAVSL